MTAANATGLRVLVVEDDADTAQALSLFLTTYGHTVHVCTDGPSALQAARDDQPDVVLLDIELPGLSGHDVAREISAQIVRKSPLLVAVTGRRDEAARQESAASGIGLHLVKPVNPEQLRWLLERFGEFVRPE